MRMHRIGQGYYYDVYDLENGRVLKKRTGHLTRLKKLLDWRGKTFLGKARIFLMYPWYAYEARRSLSRSIKTSALNPEIFGAPVFSDKFEYEQDKAIPLEAYFENHTFVENKARFDEYLGLLFLLWSHGWSDTVFNFTINSGISLKSGKLILLDFNEFADSKETIAADIKKEKWRSQAALRDMPSGELKDYILSKMKEKITLENLDRFWNRRNQAGGYLESPATRI